METPKRPTSGTSKTKDLLFTRILDEIDATEDRVRIATAAIEVSAGPTLDVTLRDHR
jgi:hypothetical protein